MVSRNERAKVIALRCGKMIKFRDVTSKMWASFKRGDAALVIKATRKSSRTAPLLKSPVSTTSPILRHKSRTWRSRAIQTDLRLAHPLLMCTLATVK